MVRKLFLLFIGVGLLASCGNETYSQQGKCGGTVPTWLEPSEGINHGAILMTADLRQNGEVFWLGEAVSGARFNEILSIASDLRPLPQFILRVEDGADCDTVRSVREEIDRTLSCGARKICGEGSGWRRAPGMEVEA
jgi:hypothetical protein